MRVMYFEHIMDSRFEGEDTKEKFDMTYKQIMDNLHSLTGVVLGHYEPYKIDWQDGSYQWRIEILVRKDSRKTTWNDVYEAINKVKAAKYRFCEMSRMSNESEAI